MQLMSIQKSPTYSQTEINDKLKAKHDSIISTTSLRLGSITTSRSIAANNVKSRSFEPPTGSLD